MIGVAAMSRLFGRSERTLWRWIKEDGFPAATLPSGHLCTSSTLVDLWLQGRLKHVRPNRPGTFVAATDQQRDATTAELEHPKNHAPPSA